MSCRKVMDALREGGETSLDVTRHLEGCAPCRRAREEERALLDALRGLPVPDPGPGHGARFRREVRARLTAEAGPAARPASRTTAALLAVAAVLIAAAGLVVALRPGGLPASGPEVVAAADPIDLPSIPEIVQSELEQLVVESWSEELDAGDGTRAWAAALTGDMDWISSLTDDDQMALLMALDEDPV